MKKDDIEIYLDKYIEKFDSNFPHFLVRGMSKEEMIKIIKEILETGNHYEPEIEEGYYY
ncbi:MAG: hypothetical protein OWP43_10920 [Sphaerochaetaceae bacterium]|nr:hypothetical protein [Sphaerochaetaceae bacterium]